MLMISDVIFAEERSRQHFTADLHDILSNVNPNLLIKIRIC